MADTPPTQPLPKRKKSLVKPVVIAAVAATALLLMLPTEEGPNLYEIRLPAGDHGSINIGWFRNGATILDPKVWLDDGDDNDPEPDDYEGVKFVGAGIDVTHLRCTSWDGITVAVGRHNGIVQLENLTLHAGYDRGTAFGEQNLGKTISPSFAFRLVNIKGVVDPPFEYFKRAQKFTVEQGGTGYRVGDVLTVPLGGTTFKVTELTAAGVGAVKSVALLTVGTYAQPPPYSGLATTGGSGTDCQIRLGLRSKWLIFAYNADAFISGCDLNSREAVEHTVYLHGFARDGAHVENTIFSGSGAEGFKVRSDATETGWAGPNQKIVLTGCEFRDWYQTWSWRGGAAIVLQGTACHVYIYRCNFYGGAALPNLPAYLRSKAIMVSSEGVSYAHRTGEVGTGFGNGHILVLECAMVSGEGTAPDWHNTIARCGKNGGTQMAARSFTMTRCGVWGAGMIVAAGDVPAGKMKITGCNTPFIADYCRTHFNMPVMPEVTFPTSTRRVPLSEGMSR